MIGWIDRPPPDSTAQILEYAESGRLVSARDDRAKGVTTLMVMAGAVIGVGAALLGTGLVDLASTPALLTGGVLVVAGLGVLTPAVRRLRKLSSAVITVRPGAVLPPDRVRQGSWIHREGSWVRVAQVGRDGNGHVQALVSTGDVIELRNPVTIAGDAFRTVRDPAEPLRR